MSARWGRPLAVLLLLATLYVVAYSRARLINGPLWPPPGMLP